MLEALGEREALGLRVGAGVREGRVLAVEVVVGQCEVVGLTLQLLEPLGLTDVVLQALPLTAVPLTDCVGLPLALTLAELLGLPAGEAVPLGEGEREGEEEVEGEEVTEAHTVPVPVTLPALRLPVTLQEREGGAERVGLCDGRGDAVPLMLGVMLGLEVELRVTVGLLEALEGALPLRVLLALRDWVRQALGEVLFRAMVPVALWEREVVKEVLEQGEMEGEALPLGVREEEALTLGDWDTLGVRVGVVVEVGEAEGQRETLGEALLVRVPARGLGLIRGLRLPEREAEGEPEALAHLLEVRLELLQPVGESVPLGEALGQAVALLLRVALPEAVAGGEALEDCEMDCVWLGEEVTLGEAEGEGLPEEEALMDTVGEAQAVASALAVGEVEGHCEAEALLVRQAEGVRESVKEGERLEKKLRLRLALGVRVLVTVVVWLREWVGDSVTEVHSVGETEPDALVLEEPLSEKVPQEELLAVKLALGEAEGHTVMLSVEVRHREGVAELLRKVRLGEDVKAPLPDRVTEKVREVEGVRVGEPDALGLGDTDHESELVMERVGDTDCVVEEDTVAEVVCPGARERLGRLLTDRVTEKVRDVEAVREGEGETDSERELVMERVGETVAEVDCPAARGSRPRSATPAKA